MSTAPPDPATDFQQRLSAVEGRLRDLARRRLEGRTEPDPGTGERWDAGQVWAHLGEFIPYWIAQAERVLAAASASPVPFGRTKANPERIEAIERDRNRGTTALWHDVREDLNDLRAFLASVSDRAWRVRGLHPTLGVMPISQIVDRFLIGHLEEHATQLENLRPR
ncbi:MAG TPA: hypothetical protein VEK76_10980 [Candidatus Binatia bacterium]|nr:hypothetical protein [Candidatus Binatia bacterium]